VAVNLPPISHPLRTRWALPRVALRHDS